MSKGKLEQIKARLKEIEVEKKKLLSELTTLQNQFVAEEKIYPQIGSRVMPSAPQSPSEKIGLFLKLFGCRTDVFPKYWENQKSGKKGYSPVCSNEWKRGICEKPKVKCSDCTVQAFKPLNEVNVSFHLKGKTSAGTYSIRKDDTCIFLAADFDKETWQEDVVLYKREGKKLGVDVAIERSKSGNGAHAWIFFSEPIPAFIARQLGSIIMTRAIIKSPSFNLTSYDRFFPNQDFIPKGGFGNLIALPLQGSARKLDNSIFIDDNFSPFSNQWEYLSSIRRPSYLEVSKLVHRISENVDKSVVSDEDEFHSWSENSLNLLTENLTGNFLDYTVKAKLSSQLIIDIEGLPPKLVAAFKRLATFANPEFFQKQKMRFSTWNLPKYIFCGDLEGQNLVLPTGVADNLQDICEDARAEFQLEDQRPKHKKFRVSFSGKLRKEQKRAVDELVEHENGVLVAAPGSGKTVMGCAVIGKRKCSTLILVHRAPLLEQWKERIGEFLKFDSKKIGVINGQKKKPQGKIDVAMMQTINKMDEKDLVVLLEKYDQIIVDECHHIAAFTFESILKKSPSRYVLGLTATPYRKDGHQAIIHMQCGPVRYEMTEQEAGFESKRVIIRDSNFKMPEESGAQPPIHQVWNHLINDEQRLELVADDVIDNLDEGRIPLVISERKEHLQLLKRTLLEKELSSKSVFILDGDLSKKQRNLLLDKINNLISKKEPVCILTTGSLIGEGFDLPSLDTLFLAMPVAFKGKVVQYAGRIHRTIEGKDEVRIYDYVDQWSGLTMSMYKKRIKSYRSMGYRIEAPSNINIYSKPNQSSFFH